MGRHKAIKRRKLSQHETKKASNLHGGLNDLSEFLTKKLRHRVSDARWRSTIYKYYDVLREILEENIQGTLQKKSRQYVLEEVLKVILESEAKVSALASSLNFSKRKSKNKYKFDLQRFRDSFETLEQKSSGIDFGQKSKQTLLHKKRINLDDKTQKCMRIKPKIDEGNTPVILQTYLVKVCSSPVLQELKSGKNLGLQTGFTNVESLNLEESTKNVFGSSFLSPSAGSLDNKNHYLYCPSVTPSKSKTDLMNPKRISSRQNSKQSYGQLFCRRKLDFDQSEEEEWPGLSYFLQNQTHSNIQKPKHSNTVKIKAEDNFPQDLIGLNISDFDISTKQFGNYFFSFPLANILIFFQRL